MRLSRLPLFGTCALSLLVACGSRPEGDKALDPADPFAPGGDLWSDPATWNGTVPGQDSDVTIPSGKKVILDQSTCVRTLTVEGTLVFAEQDLDFCARWVMVQKKGRLVVGTEERPYEHRAVITLIDGDPKEDVHGMGTKFLGAMDGGRIDFHGPAGVTPWTTLAGPVAAGSSTIDVLAASGWKSGDSIVIASGSTEPEEAEVRTIKEVNGTKLTLDAPLKFARPGDLGTIEGRVVDRRAAVGRLTRNIVVQGDPSSKDNFGGHTMIMPGGKAYIDGLELLRMGQFDHLGRYPFHWHVAGDVTGQYIKNSAVHDSFQRGIVVHSSQHALVEGNVVHNSIGHGYLVETPDTVDNVFERNLAVQAQIATHTEPTLLSQSDKEAANFWIRSARNTFKHNVAAGSNGNGFWYDGTTDGPTTFEDNVAYASAARGQADFIRESGLLVQQGGDDVTLEFKNTLLYNNATGLWPTESGTQIYKDFVLANNAGHNMVLETPGIGFVKMVSPLFIGDGPGGAGLGIQYGGTMELDKPVFKGYGGRGLLSSNDIILPWVADVRIQGASFIDTDKSVAPGVPEVSVVESIDDSFLPRGFYVPAWMPELADASMTLKQLNPDDPMEVFYGQQRRTYGVLQTLLGGADKFADQQAAINYLDTSAAPIQRSDGFTYTNSTPFVGGYPVICDAGLAYQMEAAPGDMMFAVGINVFSKWQTKSPIAVLLAIPLPSAPAKVFHSGHTFAGMPNLEGDPGTPLTKASSAADLAADPKRYFYDPATKLLHIMAQEAWTLVEL